MSRLMVTSISTLVLSVFLILPFAMEASSQVLCQGAEATIVGTSGSAAMR